MSYLETWVSAQTHSQRDLLTQRIYQIGCGDGEGNDSNCLRHDPMFKLSAGRLPFDTNTALASAATMSRFEHAASSNDIYRVSEAIVEQFIAGFASALGTLLLCLDYSEDAAYGWSPALVIEHLRNRGIGIALPMEHHYTRRQLRVIAELVKTGDRTGNRGRCGMASLPINLNVNPFTFVLDGDDTRSIN